MEFKEYQEKVVKNFKVTEGYEIAEAIGVDRFAQLGLIQKIGTICGMWQMNTDVEHRTLMPNERYLNLLGDITYYLAILHFFYEYNRYKEKSNNADLSDYRITEILIMLTDKVSGDVYRAINEYIDIALIKELSSRFDFTLSNVLEKNLLNNHINFKF